ncbi:MAG: cyclase family protein [Acidobacteria bacterium]|nr:cyclase family protein [Acidobacteriota bacterium]MBI3281092.1 cyclase family protein [Acidobacteriota bacterium]
MVKTVTAGCVLTVSAALFAQAPKGWTKGKGYGWVYGKQDEVGALNAINSHELILRALRDVKKGRVYDLGVRVDRTSYKWPGHSPTEIMSFRSPEGLKRGQDLEAFAKHPKQLGFHSCALFISDNLGTQIDGLGHITAGADNHWYNGFREDEYGTDFGINRADADSIPPVIGRAILIDVAGWKGVPALPTNFPIGSKELQGALGAQKMDIEAGDIVFIRTGTLRYWGETGSDHEAISRHDSAGLTLEGAKWLVEQKGVVFIGADTSGVEVGADPALPGAVNPVHEYLLVEQGVHLGEFHNLEALARNRVYRFTYVAMTNRLKGTVAGTAMRPIAIE